MHQHPDLWGSWSRGGDGSISTDWLCSPPGFLSFLWFVAFCFLANQWQRTTMSKGASQGADAARASIAFSFFSIIVWVSSASGLFKGPTCETCSFLCRGTATAPRALRYKCCLPLSWRGSKHLVGQILIPRAGLYPQGTDLITEETTQVS